MALVVKNTFFDVADHKFLGFEDEHHNAKRRSTSVPKTWKPVTPFKRKAKRSLSVSSSSSTRSDLSFCSTRACSFSESFDAADDSCLPLPTIDPLACIPFACATPTSPDEIEHCCSACFLNDPFGFAATTHREALLSETDDSTKVVETFITGHSNAAFPAENNDSSLTMPLDPRLLAVTEAVHSALLSSGQACRVKMEPGIQGTSPTVILAELENGPRCTSRCYDVVHIARRALEEAASRIDSVCLLSKRVQKDERGYSMRSSLACIPTEVEGRICWDLYHKGHCPRRRNCQWYHPQESDMYRVKITVRCSEETSSDDQLQTRVPAVRHMISLGDLV